ncbi:ABC transporter ATP-binding protein [Alkalicoccus urumqiensis]|uniref:Multidrug ABC transporter ATP-binding protein n=1 Tax=Alkalicoccus urumqiensis TaxID=1548213 RepID=A0A2P6MFC9_ALKUR|nr:ABC transporter ATP-binding protein [Alkalicoccus urumqiensis]PRO64988.1 multidrug ABC transporter ATP-binding protein [Alkalicoccus urumqiensis]
MTELLKLNRVSGGYQQTRPVLNDISFSVQPGEMVGLIGLNGAGKSTTIKHILGLMSPFSGSIELSGKTMADPDTYRSLLAYIPETPVLYEELTLWEHLEVTAMAYGLEKDVFEARAEKLLKEFRMKKMRKWFPSHFSKGMRQKVMIMSAFLLRPELYVADEPFVGLDPVGIHSFLTHMESMRESGAGILLSTHILATAERYCDRFVFLHEGRVLMQGTLAELQREADMPGAPLDQIYVAVTEEPENDE